jgi:hypothetical protein
MMMMLLMLLLLWCWSSMFCREAMLLISDKTAITFNRVADTRTAVFLRSTYPPSGRLAAFGMVVGVVVVGDEEEEI